VKGRHKLEAHFHMAQSLADILFSAKEPNPWIDIEKQKEDHKTQTFREEYLTMLKMAQIQNDEKYLWD
jgi:hypothetical protein